MNAKNIQHLKTLDIIMIAEMQLGKLNKQRLAHIEAQADSLTLAINRQ